MVRDADTVDSQVLSEMRDMKVGVSESCHYSVPTVECSFVPSGGNRGHIHEIDPPPPVANVSTISEDHVLHLVDGSSGHSDHLPFGGFLPKLDPDLNDGVVTVDDSSHNARGRIY